MRWPLDRSRIVTYQDCPRRRWWNYHFEGKGIERRQTALPLVTGIAVHQALEGLLKGGDPEAVIKEAVGSYRLAVAARGLQHGIKPEEWFRKEQCWMLECVMRAWHRHRLPKILDEYEILDIEKEFVNPTLHPLIDHNIRLDATMRNKETGGIEILEFKTASFASGDWQAQWERNVQILANTQGLEVIYGERCEGVKIEGLVIGQRKVDDGKNSLFQGKKIRYTPYCYAWRSEDQFGNTVYDREYRAGKAWKKVAIYDEPDMTPEKWVADFTDKELDQLFVPVPSIRPVPREMQRWKRQTVAQELKIWEGVQAFEGTVNPELVLDTYFPQHIGSCKKYGSACPFEDACFDEGIGEDPIGSGLYQERNPHHEESEE